MDVEQNDHVVGKVIYIADILVGGTLSFERVLKNILVFYDS